MEYCGATGFGKVVEGARVKVSLRVYLFWSRQGELEGVFKLL